MTLSFIQGGGVQKKKLKIKIHPPCFEKVFIKKISLRGITMVYIFPCIPPMVK